MASATMCGLTAQGTRDIGRKTHLMATENTNGLMDGGILVNGNVATWSLEVLDAWWWGVHCRAMCKKRRLRVGAVASDGAQISLPSK